jgi:hypothetical protein
MARGMSKQTLKIIEACKEILAESSPATVRGVCYQLFVRGLVANMGSKKETDKISGILTRAREKGLISWADIVDETRQAKTVSKWDDIPDYTETVLRAYRKNFWNTQSEWIEVWSEKGTIGGVLAPILKRYAVTYRVFHGYGSATAAVHDVAVLTKNHEKAPLTVLYCGDWDPSGMNMSEGDLPERLERYGGNVNITRIALTRTMSSRETFLRSLLRARKRIRGISGSSRITARRASSLMRCQRTFFVIASRTRSSNISTRTLGIAARLSRRPKRRA